MSCLHGETCFDLLDSSNINLARMLSSMPVANTVDGTDTVPAFAFPKAEIAVAGFLALALALD
jgi:hypothetical protein